MIFGRDDYTIESLNESIPADEPVFIVRASDALGAEIVHEYARRAEVIGATPAFVQNVRDHADAMYVYGEQNGTQTPTMPESVVEP